MIDVSSKFCTLRYAKAEGILTASKKTINRVVNNTVPKGNVLQVARAAGIAAAKRTAEWIIFCHNLPIDWVELDFEVKVDSIIVTSKVKAIWKTGIEMEALTAVTAALLNIYDMLKPLDDDITFGRFRLIEKKGGKSQFTDKFTTPLKGAVIVISDDTFVGKRKDNSGKIVQKFLTNYPVDVQTYEVIPDDSERITERLIQLVDEQKIRLIITTGGTGFGPKDFTPEATRKVIQIEAPGIAEAIRSHGKMRTPYAMLSREVAGLRKKSLIINLPGSSRGALESLEALFPGLLHIFPMIWGGKHEKIKSSDKP